MKSLFYIILLAAISMAYSADRYSGALCTKVASAEYCMVSPGEFAIVHMDGKLVVGNLDTPGDASRYVDTGDRRPWVNGYGVRMNITPLRTDDEEKLPAMLFESNKNVWITDRTGCVVMKYWKGPAAELPKVYSYTEVADYRTLSGLIDRCTEGKVAKGK